MKQLILGGARSGKSSLAESLTAATATKIGYLATADVRHNDSEMNSRIEHHRQQRPAHWQTLEIPIELGAALENHADDFDALMIDCLTLWLTNCLMADDSLWQQQKQQFLCALEQLKIPIIIVSNEVGMGVVPMGELSRRFVDEAGFLNQAVAQRCDRVVFTAAGLPLVMKGPALPQDHRATETTL